MDLADIKIKVDDSSSSLFYKNLTLSDVNVVRLLIEYRYKYDNYLYSDMNYFFDSAGEVQSVNIEMLLTYVALDETIKQCNFNKNQLMIINFYEHGYTHKEIAEKIGLGSNDNIRKRINTICKEIVKQNLWNWRIEVYRNVLDLKMKSCSKCMNLLPVTDEFFSLNKDSNDMFHSQCKRCKK